MEPLDCPVSLPSALVTPSPDNNMLDMDAFNLPTPDSTILSVQPQSSAAKAPKKRKSWGQPLPEPTTNLGPRKRAKTADEKEQRRIERIKRNRAAAHNSRERKRQEALHLEIENGQLKQKMALLQAALVKCREYVPVGLLPADAFVPISTHFELQDFKEESLASTPESYDTIDPRASLSAATPNDSATPYIKAEARSPSPMSAPSASTTAFTSELSLDQTRHSAAMLCDLQCRSSESTLEEKMAHWCWAQLILYLMCLNITAYYKTLLVAFWTQWPTRMSRMLTATTLSNSTLTASSATTTSRLATTTTRRTTTSIRQTRSQASTSTTLSSLLTLVSPGPSWPTTAHSFATCPKQVAISAASLALLNKVLDVKKMSRRGIDALGACPSDEGDDGINEGERRSGRSSANSDDDQMYERGLHLGHELDEREWERERQNYHQLD